MNTDNEDMVCDFIRESIAAKFAKMKEECFLQGGIDMTPEEKESMAYVDGWGVDHRAEVMAREQALTGKLRDEIFSPDGSTRTVHGDKIGDDGRVIDGS